MSRYIDVDDFLSFNGDYAIVEDYLRCHKCADVVEVKHGKNTTKMHPVDEFICSECGLILRDLTEIRIDEENEDECYYEFEVKYCPSCGTKIEGLADE